MAPKRVAVRTLLGEALIREAVAAGTGLEVTGLTVLWGLIVLWGLMVVWGLMVLWGLMVDAAGFRCG